MFSSSLNYGLKVENEFESTFTPFAGAGGIITTNRVSRGVTRQIVLKRNDFPNMIIKSGAQNSKEDVMHVSWMLPVLHSSLPILTQLEAELTKKVEQLKAGLRKGISVKLRWEV